MEHSKLFAIVHALFHDKTMISHQNHQISAFQFSHFLDSPAFIRWHQPRGSRRHIGDLRTKRAPGRKSYGGWKKFCCWKWWYIPLFKGFQPSQIGDAGVRNHPQYHPISDVFRQNHFFDFLCRFFWNSKSSPFRGNLQEVLLHSNGKMRKQRLAASRDTH